MKQIKILLISLLLIITIIIFSDEISINSLKDNKLLKEKYFGIDLGIDYNQAVEILNKSKKGFTKNKDEIIILGGLAKLEKVNQTRLIFKNNILINIITNINGTVYYYNYLYSELKKDAGFNETLIDSNYVVWNDNNLTLKINIVFENKKPKIFLYFYLNNNKQDEYKKMSTSIAYGFAYSINAGFFNTPTHDIGFSNNISFPITISRYFNDYFAFGLTNNIDYSFLVRTYSYRLYDDENGYSNYKIFNFPLLTHSIINKIKFNFKFGNVFKNAFLMEIGMLTLISFYFIDGNKFSESTVQLGIANFLGYEFKNSSNFLFTIGVNIDIVFFPITGESFKIDRINLCIYQATSLIGLEARFRFCKFISKKYNKKENL